MEFFLTPTFAAQLIYLVGLTIAVTYLLLRRNKSRDTNLILGTTIAWFISGVTATFYHITHTHLIVSGPSFENAPFLTLLFWGGIHVTLLFLALITYRIAFRFNVWEERFVVALNALSILVLVLIYIFYRKDVSVLAFSLRTASRFLIIMFLWLLFAGGRKLRNAYKTGKDLRSRRLVLMAFATVAAGFVYIQSSSYIAVIVALSAEVRGVLPLLAAVAVVGILIIGYLLYGEEPHSLLVKLVGFLIIACVTILSIVIPFMRTEVGLRTEFMDPDSRPSLIFSPDTLGAYSVTILPSDWVEPGGKSHIVGDDSAILVESAFPFPFYGVQYDSIWVGTNGSISFGADIDADQIFSAGQSFFGEVPSAMPLYADLIMAGSDARLQIDPSPERFLATWYRISNYDLHESTITMQAVLYSDGKIAFNYLDVTTVPLLNYVGISPGGNAEPVVFSGGAVNGASGQALFEYQDLRDDYRRYVHPLVVPAVWVGVMVLFLFLFLGIIFYRAGLVKPLERVLIGLRSVEQGDLNAEVLISERNELGALADYFNKMTTSLREYSGRMEELVATRTADLNNTVVDLDNTLSELRDTQAQLVEQEKLASLGALTAGIAHEIKNPLNFVNNFAEVSGELSQEIVDALETGNLAGARTIAEELTTNSEQITKHGKRADSIVRSMMQHAKGGVSEKEEIQLNIYLEEYANLAWHGMRARDDGFTAEIKREFDPDAGTIMAMPQELGRVILNLLNNAFDAVRDTDGAVVTVKTKALDNAVEITVSDNGPGIPPDIREKIFEPFFTTKATGEGTGLGLSLSYDIVTKAHGGLMTVGESQDGGAVFTITLTG